MRLLTASIAALVLCGCIKVIEPPPAVVRYDDSGVTVSYHGNNRHELFSAAGSVCSMYGKRALYIQHRCYGVHICERSLHDFACADEGF